MSSFEEEDAYLYDDEPQPKKQKHDNDQETAQTLPLDKECEDSSLAENKSTNATDINENTTAADGEEQQGKEGSDTEEYEDDDDDSDIEVLINSGSSRIEPPVLKNGPYSRVNTTSNTADGATSSSDAGPEAAAVEKADAIARRGIDLDAPGEWEGQLITDVSLDQFEDKPWRKPGADITDYFNYGFDELSWAAYCSRQDNLRDFNPQKIMRILGANNPMSMQMMNQGMMGGFNAPPGFPNAFPPGGFPDMMSMGMFPPGMPGFNQMGMGVSGGNEDDGAYGGNVQGVAGVVANPHPTGHFRNDGNDGNMGFNNNNNFNNQWNNNNR